MVAMDFLKFIDDFKVTSSIGLEDFADRYNNIYTVMVLFLCMIVISMKEYFMDPLSCYMSNPISGNKLEEYVDDYCWVQGTYAIPVKAKNFPQDDEDWKKFEDKKIHYYQWVPMVLGIQCILFIVPRVIWQIFTFSRIGTDLQRLVTTAQEAGHETSEERENKVSHVVRVLEEIFFKHRNSVRGRISALTQRFSSVCFSKRHGNELSAYYLLMKLICFTNNVGQILLMQRFLGFEKKYQFFGYEVLSHILNGQDWEQTMVFPRVTFCKLDMKHVGTINAAVAQCAIPVNMLNEKLYIFLWFWMVLGALVTLLSIFQWFFRMNISNSQGKFVRRYLRVTSYYKKIERPLVDKFVKQFLRKDGIFVLKMLSLNVGDLTTSDIVTKLWQTYKERYQNMDFRNVPLYDSETDEVSSTKV